MSDQLSDKVPSGTVHAWDTVCRVREPRLVELGDDDEDFEDDPAPGEHD
jgi:hypothetical protein